MIYALVSCVWIVSSPGRDPAGFCRATNYFNSAEACEVLLRRTHDSYEPPNPNMVGRTIKWSCMQKASGWEPVK
jgi:hypothetical protein